MSEIKLIEFNKFKFCGDAEDNFYGFSDILPCFIYKGFEKIFKKLSLIYLTRRKIDKQLKTAQ